MNLLPCSEEELRGIGKREIENLEQWLRRLIDQELSAAYGADYLDAKRPDGSRVVKSEISRSLRQKRQENPARYPRPIDATLLNDAIDIVCNPLLFEKHFRDALNAAFPVGITMARAILGRLIEPRNALSHGQPISVRAVEQIVCYSHDVIESIQGYYVSKNQDRLFNVPEVLRVLDSFGNVAHRAQFQKTVMHPNVARFQPPRFRPLRVGETFWIEVDIDPSFQPAEYQVLWGVGNVLLDANSIIVERRFSLTVGIEHVNEAFALSCNVVSNKEWHRYKGCDDALKVLYTVAPPQ